MEKTNSFIIIFGSVHFNGREVRGKSSSATAHRIPRNVRGVCKNSVPEKSVVYQIDLQTIFQSCLSVQE